MADLFLGIAGDTSVDLLVEAEVRDPLRQLVVLHWHQVLLFQDRQLFVSQQAEVVETCQVLNVLDFGVVAELCRPVRYVYLETWLHTRDQTWSISGCINGG